MKFHQSKSWKKLAAEFKTPRCIDCGSKVDLQAGHVLPASRFKMSRLWKSNLVNQCAVCNLKLGANIRWSIQAVKLLSIIMLIKALQYTLKGLIVFILINYIYIDLDRHPYEFSITGQIVGDVLELAENLRLSIFQLSDVQ